MAHKHQFAKEKDTSNFDFDSAHVVAINVAGRPISVGDAGLKLYPGEKVLICQDNEIIQKLVSARKIQVLEINSAKPKPKKIKEDKQEETFSTVAELEEETSVQLTSSDSVELPAGEQLPQ